MAPSGPTTCSGMMAEREPGPDTVVGGRGKQAAGRSLPDDDLDVVADADRLGRDRRLLAETALQGRAVQFSIAATTWGSTSTRAKRVGLAAATISELLGPEVGRSEHAANQPAESKRNPSARGRSYALHGGQRRH